MPCSSSMASRHQQPARSSRRVATRSKRTVGGNIATRKFNHNPRIAPVRAKTSFLWRFLIGEPAQQPSPFTRKMSPAEIGESGKELGPGEDGEAGVVLEDRDQGPALVDREHRDGGVVRVRAQSTGSLERCAEGGFGGGLLGAEPFDEPLEGVARDADGAVVALAGRSHRMRRRECSRESPATQLRTRDRHHRSTSIGASPGFVFIAGALALPRIS